MIGAAAYFVGSTIYAVVTVTVKTAATVYATQQVTKSYTRNLDPPEVFDETRKRFTQFYFSDHITQLAQEVLRTYQPKSAVSNIVGTGTSHSSRILYNQLIHEKNTDRLYRLFDDYISDPKNNGKKIYGIIKYYIYRNTAKSDTYN